MSFLGVLVALLVLFACLAALFAVIRHFKGTGGGCCGGGSSAPPPFSEEPQGSGRRVVARRRLQIEGMSCMRR